MSHKIKYVNCRPFSFLRACLEFCNTSPLALLVSPGLDLGTVTSTQEASSTNSFGSFSCFRCSGYVHAQFTQIILSPNINKLRHFRNIPTVRKQGLQLALVTSMASDTKMDSNLTAASTCTRLVYCTSHL